MLVDLNLAGKIALVIAKSDQALIRAKQLNSEGARVAVLIIDTPTKELLETSRRLHFPIRSYKEKWRSILKAIRPFITVISTGNLESDEKIAGYARENSHLIYVIDRPHLNDLNMTGIAKIGDIRIAVSTRGLSPAMARLLRKKIESLISKEDVMQVRLQGELRSSIRRSTQDPSQRRNLVYRLIRDEKIMSLLESNHFEEAKQHALTIIARRSFPSRVT